MIQKRYYSKQNSYSTTEEIENMAKE